ncbi:MAG: NAD-dependent epimerase/dehydratase family protein [Mucilaginibacter sp.]
MDQKIKVIVTGATGMVGEGVLQQCLESTRVSEVLIINRRPSGVVHHKLKEIIHADFFDFSTIEAQLNDYDACYFCLGVSSVGMKEPEYYRLTYTLTMHAAGTLSRLNPGMTFCYISGAHTDSTEKGGSMWARVKGKTENDLGKLPFKQEFNFRPGFMKPAVGAKNVLTLYKYMGWLYPVIKFFSPDSVCTIAEVGQAMINVTLYGFEKNILEVKDIKIAAHR